MQCQSLAVRVFSLCFRSGLKFVFIFWMRTSIEVIENMYILLSGFQWIYDHLNVCGAFHWIFYQIHSCVFWSYFDENNFSVWQLWHDNIWLTDTVFWKYSFNVIFFSPNWWILKRFITPNSIAYLCVLMFLNVSNNRYFADICLNLKTMKHDIFTLILEETKKNKMMSWEGGK